MTIWRRRRSAPPVLLPSLDRLAGLIERVVELVDAVTAPSAPDSPAAPEPAREPAPPSAPRSPESPQEPPLVEPAGWVAFVPSPIGYRLIAQPGAPPAGGATIEIEEDRYVVVRLAPSPLPGDRRRCAVLSREERSAEQRSPDA